MSSDVVYVTSFRQLDLSESISGVFTLLHGVNITNDPAVKARLLTTELSQYVGVIEFAHLRVASNLVFGELRDSDMGGLPPDRFLMLVLLWIGGLFDNAWLLTDHARGLVKKCVNEIRRRRPRCAGSRHELR